MGVVFQAQVPHQQKCLARWIHDTRYNGAHFGVGFSSFASGWPRSVTGRVWPGYPTTQNVWEGQFMIPGVVKNILN